MLLRFTYTLALAAALATATPSPTLTLKELEARNLPADAQPFARRAASCSFPNPSGTTVLTAPRTVKSGEVFDGKNQRYDRESGVCQGQTETGEADTVFIVESGGTVQNVVLGPNQAEGIFF